jgi:hypothetical protein
LLRQINRPVADQLTRGGMKMRCVRDRAATAWSNMIAFGTTQSRKCCRRCSYWRAALRPLGDIGARGGTGDLAAGYVAQSKNSRFLLHRTLGKFPG